MAWSQTEPPGIRGLPALGDGGEISLSDERRLGNQIVRTLYRHPDYLDDPVLQGYLQAIWQPLVESALRRGDMTADLAERFAWEILISRDRSVNAFALPGGYLGVHLGLIAIVTTPDELASVLAHELSHVSQRHIARLIARNNQQAPWVIGAMILGALAANAARNVDIASAAIAGGQAVAIQSQLNFSRDMEREADRVGFGILTDAGFDGMGFVTLFEKLQAASRLNDDGAFPYLRSHPLTTERMADMLARVPELGAAPTVAQAGPVSPAYHALMAARARVLSETSNERLQSLVATQRQLNGPVQDVQTLGQRYAATLAAARLRDAQSVRDGLRQLQAAMPTDPAAQRTIHWLALETRLMLPADRRMAEEHDVFRALVLQGLQSGTRAGLLLGAQGALRLGAEPLSMATQRLQAWTALNPRDALAWQTLAGLHAAQQQAVQAARAEAEARLAHFDAQSALDRLKAAQNLARQAAQVDHIELSILDSRVRDAEALLREQHRESR
jgi:predicted Zn-dependent protease